MKKIKQNERKINKIRGRFGDTGNLKPTDLEHFSSGLTGLLCLQI